MLVNQARFTKYIQTCAALSQSWRATMAPAVCILGGFQQYGQGHLSLVQMLAGQTAGNVACHEFCLSSKTHSWRCLEPGLHYMDGIFSSESL